VFVIQSFLNSKLLKNAWTQDGLILVFGYEVLKSLKKTRHLHLE